MTKYVFVMGGARSSNPKQTLYLVIFMYQK